MEPNNNIKEIIFTYTDSDNNEHTIKLNSFVNNRGLNLDMQRNTTSEYKYINGELKFVTEYSGDTEIMLSLKCKEFTMEEVE